MAGKAER